jgi:alanine racemase
VSALARLTVDLAAVAANYGLIARTAASAEVAPAVKADAYGMGAEAVSQRLWAEGARRFFVARLEEGEALRRVLPPQAVIHLLDGPMPGDAARITGARLIPVLNSLWQVRLWAAEGRGPAVLHVDTGMNRLGLRLEEVETAAKAAADFGVEAVMSHLACADEPAHPLNALQLERFRAVRPLFPDAAASLANSPGVFLGAQTHFDIVRPGVSLYGGGPRGEPDPRIGTVATLQAPVIQVRDVPPGETIGYGAAFTAREPMTVAILAAGYADGLPRSSSPRGFVVLNGVRRRLLGRVSMDLVAIDVTGAADVAPGTMAELVGPNAPVDVVASASGASAYELLTRLGRRAEVRRLGETAIAR